MNLEVIHPKMSAADMAMAAHGASTYRKKRKVDEEGDVTHGGGGGCRRGYKLQK
jgi:hypothetical protein